MITEPRWRSITIVRNRVIGRTSCLNWSPSKWNCCFEPVRRPCSSRTKTGFRTRPCGLRKSSRKLSKSNVRTSELAAEVARERDATQAALNLANVTMADMYAAYGLHSAEDGNDREAVLWFAHALLKSKDDPERLRANRLRYQTWSRQISRPIAVVQNPRQVNRLTFHPSNRYLLSQSFQAGQHDTVLDVSTNSVRSELRTMAWTPDGQVQAYAKELAVHVADFPSLADRLVIPLGERAHLVAFDQKAERLAVACEQSVHLFNPLSGATLSPEWKLSDPQRHLAISPDGRFAYVGGNGTVHVINLDELDEVDTRSAEAILL